MNFMDVNDCISILIFVHVISKLPNPGREMSAVCQLPQKALMMWEDDDTAVRVMSIA